MRKTMMTSNYNRFRASALFLVTLAASLLLAPGVAYAWEVDLSIRGAGRVTETTDANLVGQDCLPGGSSGLESPYYTWTGMLGAKCSPGSPDGAYGHGWIVRYVAEAHPGYRFDRWQSNGSTSTWPVLCDGSNLSDVYTGSGCQFQIWRNLQIEAVFVDDTAPSAPRFESWPTKPVNGPISLRWDIDRDPTMIGIECRVAGVHDWRECIQGVENPPESGTYTLEARARDRSDNLSPVVSRQWTVDKIAPTVASATPANGLANQARNTSLTATFSEQMDPSTLTSSTFQLYQGQWTRVKKKKGKKKRWVWVFQGWAPVSDTQVSCDNPCKTATLDPSSDLAANSKYLAEVTTGAKDEADNALSQNYSWTFTTGAT